MDRSDTLTNLAAALKAVQAEAPAIPKTSDNPFFKSKYADLADVKAIADPIVTKHGLSVSQWPSSNERGDTLYTLLLHESGEFLGSEMVLHPVKTDPQGQGSAITYARRYAYCAALGLVSDADDDGNAASQPQQQQGNNSGGNAQRSGGAAAKKATAKPGTTETQLDERISKLTADQQTDIRKKIADGNYPKPLPAGAIRTVEKWVAEAEQGRPF